MKRVLIVTGDGAEPELEYAVFRMREEGIQETVAAPIKKPLFVVFHQQEEGWDNGIERPWYPTKANAAFDDVDPAKYDGLLLPGGRAPVYLRNFPRCNAIVRHFMDSNKPVAAIGRGSIVLVTAGSKGRRFTGDPLIRPRVEIGGCTFVETRGEPLRDGNIVTVSGRPYYHVWIREFLKMLRTPDRVPLSRSA
jgi:protease I